MANLVPIEEKDLARYLRMQTLADSIIEYMTQDEKEQEDFIQWSEGDPYTITEEHLHHIFGEILLYKHLSGYDIAPFCISTELLKSEEEQTND